MKTCTKCNSTKSDNEFYKKGKEKRTASWCKVCFNSYCMTRWTARKVQVVEQRGNKCADCAVSYHPAVYEFHHLDPSSKEMNWNKMRLLSEIKMQHELSKCVMLCANCHRMRHVEERLSS